MAIPFKISRRALLPVISLAVAWACLYLVLRANDAQRGGPRALATGSGAEAGPQVLMPAIDTGLDDEQEPLERRFERFYVPELHISRLATILAAEGLGLQLEYPADLRDVSRAAEYARPVSTAEILYDMVAPLGYGFMRQGHTVRIVPMRVHRERRRREAQSSTTRVFVANKVETDFRARAGEPLDIWLSLAPRLRLRLLAQPLHSEFEDVARGVGMVAVGLREDEVWFRHQFETYLGRAGRIDVRATESMWCLLTPSQLEGEDISMQVELYYESFESNP